MRLLIFFLLLVLGAGCAGIKNVSGNHEGKLGKLNGTWIPLKQEMHGTTLPEAAYVNQKLIISDSTYTFVAESVDKGVIKYEDNKIDIYGKEGVNAGKHFTAIYKYEKGELTICYNLSGDSYPEAFETKSKPLLFLSVFTKRDSKIIL